MRGTWASPPHEGQPLCSCLDDRSYSNHPHREMQQKAQNMREEARCFRWGWRATPLKQRKDHLHDDTEAGGPRPGSCGMLPLAVWSEPI